jgi:hypothetical protein
VRHIGNVRVEVRAQISTSIYEKYQRAQSLLASKGKPTTLEGVLQASLDLFLDRHDPVRKAERAQSRAAKRTEQGVEETQSKPTEHAEAPEIRVHASLSVEDIGVATEIGSEKAKATGSNAGAIESASQKSVTTGSDTFCLNGKSRSTTRASASPQGNTGGKPSGHFPGELAGMSDTKPSEKMPGELSTKPSSLRAHDSRRSTGRREHIKAKTNHALMLRTRGQCSFVNEHGERCKEDRYLHRHHIIPLSQGGSDDLENLTLLCPAHHALIHQLSLPIDGQVTWLRSPQVAYLA